jgi:hypothetical protein
MRILVKNKYFNGNIFGIIIMNFQKYLKIYLFIFFGNKDKRKNIKTRNPNRSAGHFDPDRPIRAAFRDPLPFQSPLERGRAQARVGALPSAATARLGPAAHLPTSAQPNGCSPFSPRTGNGRLLLSLPHFLSPHEPSPPSMASMALEAGRPT